MGFTGFKWVLLGLSVFYWVLLGFTRFYLVLLGFTGFYLVLLSVTGFLSGFHRYFYGKKSKDLLGQWWARLGSAGSNVGPVEVCEKGERTVQSDE